MAAIAAGEAFVHATVWSLVDRLASQTFVNSFRGRKVDESLIKKLKVTLLALSKVLDDAETKQFTDSIVRDWLNELKDSFYDAEDLVDEITTEALRCKVEAEYRRGQKRFRDSLILPWNWSHGRGMNFESDKSGGMNSKLEQMVDMFDHFLKTKDAFGLRVAGQNWSQTRLPTSSLVDESCVYGRENDKVEIMKLLLSDCSDGIDVIPIVGMGGVGKTTLAQLLYNDGMVDFHFSEKSWVCVSDVFDVFSVGRTIIEAINGWPLDAKDLNSLQVNLKKSLSGKKFLIVLDDVWVDNNEYWGVLMTLFKCGAHGSKIIITTRNDSVASPMKTVHIHHLQKLPEEDCWKLFSHHAFEKGDFNANLEMIGREIVKKCKGLPLAVKSLGGLLRSQRDVQYWNNILESDIWELPDEKSNILPALILSYHCLPSHLKRCFAYCSIFTKDYEFDKKKLVSIWMAEGLLKKSKNYKTVEEEGYECFDELLSRSFFQKSNAKDHFFVMHDLVHDLAQFVTGDFCYRLLEGKPRGMFEKVRHFSYDRATFGGYDKFRLIKDAKCVRTFLQMDDRRLYNNQCLSKKELDEILKGLTRLRLLSLPGYQIKELPYSIGNLIYLRFLNLSDTQIDQLPKSVCTLHNLETLLLSGCHRLTALPAEFVKLISLRHLDLSGTNLKEMPMHISRLNDLQQLTAFVVGKCSGSGINELKELRLCGTIIISGLQNVTSGSDALEAKMREKKYLVKLALDWDSTLGLERGRTKDDLENESDVLEKLEPHTNLKHLHIENYRGTRFPTWLGDQSFCNMVSLCLKNCDNCTSLPPLGQLASLKELTISRMSGIKTVDHGFYGRSGSLPFEYLETLRFQDMFELVDWCGLDAGEFCRLKTLDIINCPKLTGDLPKRMPSLMRLNIQNCPEIESFPSVGLPSTLTDICIQYCEKLVAGRRDWGLRTLPSLTSFSLAGGSECLVESFPEEGLLPSNLTDIRISDLPNLKSLNKRGLQLLGSLKCMHICNSPQLQSLPEEGFPTSLLQLRIWDCPLLKRCFRRKKGDDWHKIAHIPLIDIDREVIGREIYLSQEESNMHIGKTKASPSVPERDAKVGVSSESKDDWVEVVKRKIQNPGMRLAISLSSSVPSTTNAFGVLEKCEDSGVSSAMEVTKIDVAGDVSCDVTPILHGQGSTQQEPPPVALRRSTRFQEPPRIPLAGDFIGARHCLNQVVGDSSTPSSTRDQNKKKLQKKIKMLKASRV